MKKLFLGPGAVIVMILIMAATAFQGMLFPGNNFDRVYPVNFKEYQALAQVRQDITIAHGNISKAISWIIVFDTDKQKVEKLADEQRRLVAAIDERLTKLIIALDQNQKRTQKTSNTVRPFERLPTDGSCRAFEDHVRLLFGGNDGGRRT